MDSKASERSALQEIIDNALLDMRREAGGELDLEHVNLADFCRRTGLSRSKAAQYGAMDSGPCRTAGPGRRHRGR